MKIHRTCLGLMLCLTLLAAVPAVSQSSDATPETAAAAVAYVYAQTSNGVNLYDATAAGKLILVEGSPFQPSGPGQTIVGSNGKYFVMLGANDLHSYPVASNGAIEEQESQTDTQSYGGSECEASITSGEFDHTGDNLYVLLGNAGTNCSAIQTYALSKSGHFVFSGDTTADSGPNLPIGPATTTGNGKFGYGGTYCGYDNCSCYSGLNLYKSESKDGLQYSDVSALGALPPIPAGYKGDGWITSAGGEVAIANDATDHMALALSATNYDCEDGATYSPVQLVSLTANSEGTLNSTNTDENAPVISGWPNSMSISPSGKVLAVALGTGIEFFHFNGANPITKFTGIIGLSGSITVMQWDKSNHLYAINGATGKVHVYTVTTTSAAEVAGSPYSIGATGLVVAVP
jgi:hypothetical protein